MAFTPESPFPKAQGNPIRSRDWNALVVELQRLDTAKVNRLGDAMGPLKISNGVAPLAGSANNGALVVTAGSLPAAAGSELTLANVGFISGNNSSLGIRARRVAAGGDWTTSAIGLEMDVDNTPRAGASIWLGSGAVGIGTATPADKLDVAGPLRILSDSNPIRFTSAWSGFPDAVSNQAEISNDIGTYKTLMIIGNRSAGLPGPAFGVARRVSVWDRLEVNGFLAVTNSISGGETGTGWTLGGGLWGPDNWLRLTTTPRGDTYHDFACGTFWAAGATRFDLAEMTPVREEDALSPGEVVVIDAAAGLRATRSRRPYDTSVYGIVSSAEQAAMVIGGDSDPEQARNRKDQVPVALAGRVKARISSENGPIRTGDLLTTADTPGHLMLCSDRERGFGAVAGKALEAFDGERGSIMVLVTLQ